MMKLRIGLISAAVAAALLSGEAIAQSGATGSVLPHQNGQQSAPDPKSAPALPSTIPGEGTGSGSGASQAGGGTLVQITPESCREGWRPALNISQEEFLQACQRK
jgi:hypothetical protein